MAEITFQVDGVAITKRIADISEGGIFIDTPVPSEVGTPLSLRFSLDGEAIEAEGRVAYSQPYIGMGVEFTEISPDSMSCIRTYVSRAAESMAVGAL